jgi:hypothetical protein
MVEVEEVIRFWHDYEHARIANQRLIELQVVRSAINAITALESAISELEEDLDKADERNSALRDKITQYNPMHWMEE